MSSATLIPREFSRKQTLIAIGLMLISTVSFAIMGICIRQLSGEMHSAQMVFVRSAISVGFLLPILWRKGGIPALKTKHFPLHFWRALLGIIGMEIWFYTLTQMPINQATALSFTAPLFATIIAVLFFKESIGIRRIGALLVGFSGVLIILRPFDAAGIPSMALMVLVATVMWASASNLVKVLARLEPDWKVVFYMSLFMTLFSAPLCLIWWNPISPLGWVYLTAIAVTGLTAHWAMTAAFSRADIVTLMPFDFTRLLFTAILAYFFLGEVIDAWTAIGALVVVASCVYIATRSGRRGKTTLKAAERRGV